MVVSSIEPPLSLIDDQQERQKQGRQDRRGNYGIADGLHRNDPGYIKLHMSRPSYTTNEIADDDQPVVPDYG